MQFTGLLEFFLRKNFIETRTYLFPRVLFTRNMHTRHKLLSRRVREAYIRAGFLFHFSSISNFKFIKLTVIGVKFDMTRP